MKDCSAGKMDLLLDSLSFPCGVWRWVYNWRSQPSFQRALWLRGQPRAVVHKSLYTIPFTQHAFIYLAKSGLFWLNLGKIHDLH